MQLAQFLCRELSVTPTELVRFLSAAPNKYKIYAIPKRSSGKRIIAHPAKRLKEYQRLAVKYLEPLFQVHSSAYAYRKGLSIKTNAECHKDSRYLLKMDFQDFFHSINDEFFFIMCSRMGVELSKNDKSVLSPLLFWRPSKKSGGKLILSIGAPSSPFISNCLLYSFDNAIYSACKARGITYTRYADDLTLSTNIKGALFGMPEIVRELLVTELQGYITLNESKTVFSSKAHNRHVTGVTLTNDDKLSLGRQRKRYISSLVHQYRQGQLPPEDLAYLKGLLSFAKDIEPDFLTRLEVKYTKNVMDQLREIKI